MKDQIKPSYTTKELVELAEQGAKKTRRLHDLAAAGRIHESQLPAIRKALLKGRG